MTVNIITGLSLKCYPVAPESIEAVTRQRMVRKRHEADDEIWVNQGAGGLGDALLGLCAIRGLKRRCPNKKIIYRVSAPIPLPPLKTSDENGIKQETSRIPFVALFDGGYDGLADHVWDKTWHDFPEAADVRDLQLNLGYTREIQGKAELTRLQRYCRNLGWVTPELPTVREPTNLQKRGEPYKDHVVLCPFTGLQSRDWPQFYWMTLEDMLNKAGIQTIICGALRHENTQRADCFRSALAIHTDENPVLPELTAGIISTASCVVACDSGLAHLSALLGKRTIVICGWSRGERIYDFYPSVEIFQGSLPCTGCWTLKEMGFDEERCTVTCDNLGTITPEMVFKQITTNLGQ